MYCSGNSGHCKHSCLSRVPVFGQLTEQEFRQVESITESKPYPKGSFVFREGELSDSLFVLSQGLIKLSKTSEKGREHVLRFLFPGDFFGHFSLLTNKQHYANAELVEDGIICRIPNAAFRPILLQSASMSFRFLQAMSEQLHYAEEWAGALHMLEVEQRLAKLLIYLYRKDASPSGDVLLPAAKKEMASMIGTTAETLSRKLSLMENQQFIAVNKRVVRILNVNALIQMAGNAAPEAVQ